MGTDIAGSSRIPSAFCGLWALKCTEGRLPHDGIATVLTGLPTASGSIGLMSNDLDTLQLTFKSLLDSNLSLSDPCCVPLLWRQDILDSIRRRNGCPEQRNGRLVFGVMRSDDCVHPHPSIQRAITLVTEALSRCGHEIVEWKPPSHSAAVENLLQILGSTSAIEARAALDSSGEPPIPQIAHWYQHQDIEPNTTVEFWELCAKRHQYCTDYKAYWNSIGDSTRSGRVPDGVILPVTAGLAVRPGQFHYYGYSAIANVLDYPSGVLPITYGDRSLDDIRTRAEPLSDMDEKVQRSCKSYFSCLNESTSSLIRIALVQPEDIQGLPVACQVMCPRFQEEAVLGLMQTIAECLSTSSPSAG
jgi:amidase